MAETLTIRTAASTEVVKIAVQGPQGPKGDKGDPGDVAGLPLTTQGDTLYRGASQNERLGIGQNSQILKVVNGLPAWANESGAVSSVAGRTGAVTLFSVDVSSEQVLEISEAGDANCNGVFVYGGDFNGRPTYYKDKDTFVYWDNVWNISHNSDDKYVGTNTSRPWQAVWSLGSATGNLPVVERLNGQEYEKAVGQRTNPTLRGDAAGKNVGAGSNDVAAGNHTHTAATQSVAGFLSAADKTKLDSVASGAEVNVNADWTASSGDAQILNKPSSFTPAAHAAAHASSGSDPLAPSDIGLGATDAVEFLSVKIEQGLSFEDANENTASINFIEGNAIEFTANEAIALNIEGGENPSVNYNAPFNFLDDEDDAKKSASRANLGLGDAATADIGTAAGEVAEGDHVHGNITSDGKVGSTSGLPLVTTTAGAVTTLALGTANQVLRVNSGASGVEFADPAASGVTGAASSASDVLGVSGANITGVDAGSDKIVFWDDSASELTYLTVGSGLSLTDTTLTATATGGGTKTYAVFTAEHNQPPSTAFATLDTRNSIAVLDFDDTAVESAVFVGVMPEAASLGSGLIVRLHWMPTNDVTTSRNVRWRVAFERSNTDLDADSFATNTEANGAVPSTTSGIPQMTSITVASGDLDGITAGDLFRLRVTRVGSDSTNDTCQNDAELVAVEVRSAA